MILPATDGEGAREVARKVLEAIRDLGLEHAHSSAAEIVTMSIGVATAWPTQGVEPGTLIEAADQSLYQAKESGRNRVGH